MVNAGLRLWTAQKKQGTGLCVGLDPHLRPMGDAQPMFYNQFVRWDGGMEAMNTFLRMFRALGRGLFRQVEQPERAAEFLAGLLAYMLEVVEIAWANGLRVYKPQAAFYERLGPYGLIILEAICNRLHELAVGADEIVFVILDCKRGDIDSTQEPYFALYETVYDEEVIPGMSGRYDFDTMTVTTWMGRDVLTPGLPYFHKGKGAIVVTRSSNPSGTTFQDGLLSPEPGVRLSVKQEPFRYDEDCQTTIRDLLNRNPLAHEVMLYETSRFSTDNGLDQDGVSPIFSVMGSTVRMLDSFRIIRPGGIALVPGFGYQDGAFNNIGPLYVKEGPLKGHIGILASSRENDFPWWTKFGGSGDPSTLRLDMARVIDKFRKDERAFYERSGFDYPF